MPLVEELRRAINTLKPEAQELIQRAREDLTTKDGYGTVMNCLLQLKDQTVEAIMMVALREEGYPKETLETLARIMGIGDRYEAVLDLSLKE